ncbi:MAG: DUF1566 domain-containing protein [Geobacteraceae bacterium]
MAVCARCKGIKVILAGLIALFVWSPCHPDRCSADNETFVAEDETFVLPESGVLWTRDGNPAGRELSWSDSLDFLTGLNDKKFAGCEGWRLPSSKELTDLQTYLNSGNADDEDISPEQDYYWASSIDPLDASYSDAVNLADGSVDSCDKTEINFVWPVCGEQ